MEGHGQQASFSVWDYVVFGIMLCISAGIGVFHAIVGGRQKTTKEYLVANRSMGGLPVGMSLVASFMSAITVLGAPAEVYLYGTMYWWFAISYALVSLAVAYIYMPIFYNLQITSAYEYLEMRFNRPVRWLGMVTFQLQMLLYLGIAIYAPALALNHVTGFTLWGSVWACGIVCTFYCTILCNLYAIGIEPLRSGFITNLFDLPTKKPFLAYSFQGGIKAVIWTDVFQVCVMLVGFLMVIIKGTIDVGGIKEVWRIAEEGGRLDFIHFEPDPRIRHTFWSIVVGGTLMWLAVYAVNQSQVQRYISCKTITHARGALLFNVCGLCFILTGACLCGLVMYANYVDCDPYTDGRIDASDQLLPYLVMDILGGIPGLPGIFVAALFSGALSTVSSGLNALAAVVAEDFIKPRFQPNERLYTFITKALVFAYGMLCIGMSYIASTLGSVLSAAFSIFGMVGGPLLGLFSLAMFFPWCNSKGAAAGLLTGLTVSFWVGIGAIVNPPPTPLLFLTTENCTNATTVAPLTTLMTTPMEPVTPSGLEDWWYGMSYLWYSGVAIATVVIVGLLTSFLTGAQKPSELDPRLMSPFFDLFLCCLPVKWRSFLWCGVRHDEEHVHIEDEAKSKETYSNGEIPSSEKSHAFENPTYFVDDDSNGNSDSFDSSHPDPLEDTHL